MVSNSQPNTSTPEYPERENCSSSHVLKQKNNYRPSVPIYIYRQLVKDLEVTKAELETLQSENNKLAAQNQQLKAEVTKIVTSAQNLSAILHDQVKNQPPLPLRRGELKVKSSTPAINSKALDQNSRSQTAPVRLVWEHNQSHLPKTLEPNSRLNVFWLVVAVIFMVVTCSVGSFFVAKSFLKHND
jgi:hypothetical protein